MLLYICYDKDKNSAPFGNLWALTTCQIGSQSGKAEMR